MNDTNDLSEVFFLVQRETALAKSCIVEGVNRLRRANAGDHTGNFYNSFFQLSIGIERLMKIMLVIDGHVDGRQVDLKKFSHDIEVLYNACSEIRVRRGFPPLTWNTNAINKEILGFLKMFASQTRYYNLDALSGKKKLKDPLVTWDQVLDLIYAEDVPNRRKRTGIELAKKMGFVVDQAAFLVSHDFKNEQFTAANLFLTQQKFNLAIPYSIWRIHQLITDLCEPIIDIGALSRDEESKVDGLPYFEDFFPFIHMWKDLVLKRQTWL